MIDLIFTLLIGTAVLIAILIVCSLLLWLKGASSIVFPGLGLVVATPLITILLILVQLGVVICAIFVSSMRRPALP